MRMINTFLEIWTRELYKTQPKLILMHIIFNVISHVKRLLSWIEDSYIITFK